MRCMCLDVVLNATPVCCRVDERREQAMQDGAIKWSDKSWSDCNCWLKSNWRRDEHQQRAAMPYCLLYSTPHHRTIITLSLRPFTQAISCISLRLVPALGRLYWTRSSIGSSRADGSLSTLIHAQCQQGPHCLLCAGRTDILQALIHLCMHQTPLQARDCRRSSHHVRASSLASTTTDDIVVNH